MKSKNFSLIYFSLIVVLGCWILNYNLYNIPNADGQFYVGTASIIMISVLASYFLVKCGKHDNLVLFCLFVVVGSLVWATQIPVFSPIDESAHFAYINYICENGDLPLVTSVMDTNSLLEISSESISSGIMYEAVHPPIYYCIAAFLCKLTKSVIVRFWICRLFGCAVLTVIASIIYSWCKYVNQVGLISSEEKSNLVICALSVMCMPGVFTRFGTVSNEGLAAFFVTLILFEITKAICEGLTWKHFWMINILIVLAFLTKITTIFVIVLWLMTIVYYKKHKMGLLSISVIGCGIVPWLLYNYINYGSLTATEEHLSYVLPIVNPNKLSLDIISGIGNIFYYFIYPQEGIVSEMSRPIIYFLNGLLLLLLLMGLCEALKNVGNYVIHAKCHFEYTMEEKKEVIKILYSFCVLGNIVILVLGSMGTYVSVMIGRYLYLSFIPLIFLLYICINKSGQMKMYRIISVFACVLCIENILTYMKPELSNLVGIMCEYDSVDTSNITSYDVTIEDGKVVSGVHDPQITFLDELTDKYNAVKFELDAFEGSDSLFAMYYAVDGIFTEENKVISYYDEQQDEICFVFNEEIELTNIRLDPPFGSTFMIKDIKVIK